MIDQPFLTLLLAAAVALSAPLLFAALGESPWTQQRHTDNENGPGFIGRSSLRHDATVADPKGRAFHPRVRL